MRLRRIVVAALVIVAVAAPVAAQSDTPVTVETREGEVVDDVLVSATGTEVVIRIAGQPLTLAVESLRYISFDGLVEVSPPRPRTSATLRDSGEIPMSGITRRMVMRLVCS